VKKAWHRESGKQHLITCNNHSRIRTNEATKRERGWKEEEEKINLVLD
jgi:hypothetical protein